MTPDTAALRAMADHVEKMPPFVSFGGHVHPYTAQVETDTLRALCDAADEVERLTSKYEEWESMHSACIALREEIARQEREAVVLNESIDRHARDLDAAGESLRRLTAERDAARTAHAALVADLRALVGPLTSASTYVHEGRVVVLRDAVLAVLDRPRGDDVSGDCQAGDHGACDGGFDVGPNEHPCHCDCHGGRHD